ncbi:MAG: DUF2171 domain-containing protein [Dehalococcoidia bacterium]
MTYERTMPEPSGAISTPDMTTTPGSAAFPALTPDCPVYTADGDKLGTVKEIRGSAFKVNAHMQPDYWLSFGGIRAVTPERVELAFPKDRLGDYKQDSPVQG